MVLTDADITDISTKTATQRKAAKRGLRKNKALMTQPLIHPGPPIPATSPVISQATRGRLYAEAKDHHLVEFMDTDDGLIEDYLASQPWWYGHTGGPDGADARYHASRQHYQARRAKEKEGRAKSRSVPVEECRRKEARRHNSSEERVLGLRAA